MHRPEFQHLERVHIDYWHATCEGVDASKYILGIKDEATGMVWGRPTLDRLHTFELFKEFCADAGKPREVRAMASLCQQP